MKVGEEKRPYKMCVPIRLPASTQGNKSCEFEVIIQDGNCNPTKSHGALDRWDLLLELGDKEYTVLNRSRAPYQCGLNSVLRKDVLKSSNPQHLQV